MADLRIDLLDAMSDGFTNIDITYRAESEYHEYSSRRHQSNSSYEMSFIMSSGELANILRAVCNPSA